MLKEKENRTTKPHDKNKKVNNKGKKKNIKLASKVVNEILKTL